MKGRGLSVRAPFLTLGTHCLKRLTACQSIGRLNGRISSSPELASAAVRHKEIQDVTESAPKRLTGAGFGLMQMRFESAKACSI